MSLTLEQFRKITKDLPGDLVILIQTQSTSPVSPNVLGVTDAFNNKDGMQKILYLGDKREKLVTNQEGN